LTVKGKFFLLFTSIFILQGLNLLFCQLNLAVINPFFVFGFFNVSIALYLTALVIFAYYSYYVFKSSSFLIILALGGIFSNFIDRIARGGVVDYIYLPIIKLNFNLADLLIIAGCISFFFISVKVKHPPQTQR